MIPLRITMNLELDPWEDLRGREFVKRDDGEPNLLERIALLPQGMTSGRASVELMGTLPDGRAVVLTTSFRNFQMAAVALLNSPVAQMEDL